MMRFIPLVELLLAFTLWLALRSTGGSVVERPDILRRSALFLVATGVAFTAAPVAPLLSDMTRPASPTDFASTVFFAIALVLWSLPAWLWLYGALRRASGRSMAALAIAASLACLYTALREYVAFLVGPADELSGVLVLGVPLQQLAIVATLMLLRRAVDGRLKQKARQGD